MDSIIICNLRQPIRIGWGPFDIYLGLFILELGRWILDVVVKYNLNLFKSMSHLLVLNPLPSNLPFCFSGTVPTPVKVLVK